MKRDLTSCAAGCSEPFRYSISAILIVLLLGLLPAACSNPGGDPKSQAASRGEVQSSAPGAGAPERPGDNRPPDV